MMVGSDFEYRDTDRVVFQITELANHKIIKKEFLLIWNRFFNWGYKLNGTAYMPKRKYINKKC